MATFHTEGIDEIIRQMEIEGESVGPIADEMLMAGAEIVRNEWVKSGDGHRRTGDMLDSTGYADEPHSINDYRSIDIYPRGKDRRGTRNAMKAFLLNYGFNGVPGDGWVDDARENAEPLVEAEFQRIWDSHHKNN